MFSLSAFLTYAFVVTFTPGPNNIMSMVNATKYGYKGTLKFIIGVTSGFFLIMWLCNYFNIFLYSILPNIQTTMSITGATYMTYLGLKIMGLKLPSTSSNKNKTKASDVNINSYKTGMMLQLVNPKVILYGITITSTFITPYFKSSYQLFLASAFLALIGFAAVTSWALFGSLFNKILSKYDKILNTVMGLLLFYSALTISGLF